MIEKIIKPTVLFLGLTQIVSCSSINIERFIDSKFINQGKNIVCTIDDGKHMRHKIGVSSNDTVNFVEFRLDEYYNSINPYTSVDCVKYELNK